MTSDYPGSIAVTQMMREVGNCVVSFCQFSNCNENGDEDGSKSM